MCKYCGSDDGCEPVGGLLADIDHQGYMTVEDWRKVYWFMKYVYLPFIHQIIANALSRGKRQDRLDAG